MNHIAKEANDKKKIQYEWYKLRPILGNANWAMFYILLGGREAGKSYAALDYFLWKFKTKGNPFYWMRLSKASADKLLKNNALNLVDPDLRRRYNLDLETNGNRVYNVVRKEKVIKHKNGTTSTKKYIESKTLMCTVIDASTFHNDKGQGYFDNQYLKEHPTHEFLCCLDEMNREQTEKNTFDITYAVVNQFENLFRSTKDRIKIFMIGNTLEEASDLMCCFNFIPEEFGTYKIKKKRAVVEYIEPSEAYKARRKGTIADILMPNASTFTNKIDTDTSLVNKERLQEPRYVIAFTKNKADWFTVWNSAIIAKYNGEKKTIIPMRPYLDKAYNQEAAKNIIEIFDSRGFQYRDLITFKQFQKNLTLLKPRKQG